MSRNPRCLRVKFLLWKPVASCAAPSILSPCPQGWRSRSSLGREWLYREWLMISTPVAALPLWCVAWGGLCGTSDRLFCFSLLSRASSREVKKDLIFSVCLEVLGLLYS
ncbi:hypothetical protein Micbo1qcDRAFT_167675 [Microdochium bolleyi]|uniref:Uncharacterized protein n=1 Tax=Microdochium bolleyi TaxID=196109 RepID=A0A136IQV7_9PEZI|nr:hypothetical protein Micbo1qcDRAFT_167675 [Microdochium bolleyi]